VLESSGISVKPTANQLNEFAKKIKSLNHQLILRNLFERMNKSILETDNKMLAKLLYVIQAIIQDSSNTNYINFLKQQAKLFENIFNKNINKIVNTISAEIYKTLTNTNLMKEEEFLGDNNNINNNLDNINNNEKKELIVYDYGIIESKTRNRFNKLEGNIDNKKEKDNSIKCGCMIV
jgi:hypothetical protein